MVVVAEEGPAWPKRAFRAVYRSDGILMVFGLAVIGGGMALLVFTSG
jgi:hypothetical protein